MPRPSPAGLPASVLRARGSVSVGAGRAEQPERVYLWMLYDALRPDGVHVGQLVVRRAVGPGLRYEPDTVAEPLWRHHI